MAEDNEAPKPPKELSYTIKEEIDMYYKDFRASRPSEFFNNFPNYIPQGKRKAPMERGMLKSMYELSAPKHKNAFSPEEQKNHSKMYLDKNPREFVDDIQKTIEEMGISIEEMTRLYELRNDLKQRALYFDFILPIYRRLREKGYKRLDLWK